MHEICRIRVKNTLVIEEIYVCLKRHSVEWGQKLLKNQPSYNNHATENNPELWPQKKQHFCPTDEPHGTILAQRPSAQETGWAYPGATSHTNWPPRIFPVSSFWGPLTKEVLQPQWRSTSSVCAIICLNLTQLNDVVSYPVLLAHEKLTEKVLGNLGRKQLQE